MGKPGLRLLALDENEISDAGVEALTVRARGGGGSGTAGTRGSGWGRARAQTHRHHLWDTHAWRGFDPYRHAAQEIMRGAGKLDALGPLDENMAEEDEVRAQSKQQPRGHCSARAGAGPTPTGPACTCVAAADPRPSRRTWAPTTRGTRPATPPATLWRRAGPRRTSKAGVDALLVITSTANTPGWLALKDPSVTCTRRGAWAVAQTCRDGGGHACRLSRCVGRRALATRRHTPTECRVRVGRFGACIAQELRPPPAARIKRGVEVLNERGLAPPFLPFRHLWVHTHLLQARRATFARVARLRGTRVVVAPSTSAPPLRLPTSTRAEC